MRPTEDPHLVDVELVEGDETFALGAGAPAPGTGAAEGGDTARGPHSRGGHHVRAWAALAALAALTAVVLVAHEVQVRADETRLAALAEVPGVLGPLAEPLAEAWRVPAGRPIARTGRAVLTTGLDSPGELWAWDLETGEEVWRRDGGPREACRPLLGARDTGPDLPYVTHVVCLPRGGWGMPLAGEVVVVDAATGERVRSTDVDGALFADVADRLVLLTGAEPDGTVTTTAWQPVTGGVAWSFRSDPGLLDLLASSGGGGYAVRDGVVSLGNRDHGFALEVATGHPVELPGRAADAGHDAVDLPGGASARWVHDRFGRPQDVEVVGPDGERRFASPGVPWLARVSDASAPEVVVVRRTGDQHLLGLDARDGRVRWDLANVPWLSASVQVDGVVVGVGPSSAVVLDLRTGLRLWSRPVARGAGAWDALTDGRVVLLPEDDDTGVRLAARGLTTGELRWSVPLPADAVALQQVDGRTVLVVTEAALVALR